MHNTASLLSTRLIILIILLLSEQQGAYAQETAQGTQETGAQESSIQTSNAQESAVLDSNNLEPGNLEPGNLEPNDDSYEEVIVTSRKHAQKFRTAQHSIELSGDDLRLQISNTLGETLSMQPGVHNASFGPSVGLPVLRGMSGVRVRILEDGIGTWDASALSPDHANAIEPVLAERIQVLHGASTIQFGSAAIGGVVAVDTQRIPIEKTGHPITASIETRKEWNNNHGQLTSAGKIGFENKHFGLHIDSFKRKHDTVSIANCAIDTQAVIAQFGFDANQSNTCGHVANSDANAQGFSVGNAFTGPRGYIGTSIRQLDYEYGIPPGSHTEPRDTNHHNHATPNSDEEQGDPLIRIDMEQRRYDIAAGLSLNNKTWSKLELRAADINYEHRESENNAPGTLFKNNVTEAKLQAHHQLYKNWQGIAGIQAINRHFSATGLENFIPPSKVNSYGLFIVESTTKDAWTIQIGARYDYNRIEQKALTAKLRPNNLQLLHTPIYHQTFSFQLSGDYKLNDFHQFGLSVGRSQRAPDVQEVFSLGPHLATRSYDIGLLIRGSNLQSSTTPEAETFNHAEISWQWHQRWGKQQLQLFYNAIDDFIYQRNTGIFYDLAEQLFRNNCVRLAECLPVYEYTQENASLAGFEWQWTMPEWQTPIGFWQLRLFSDYVRGRLDDGNDIPRMPAWRYGLEAEWWHGNWFANMHTTHITPQNKPGEFETKTSSHTQINGSLNYRFSWNKSSGVLFLRCKNLTNENIRSATSFIRNFSPEPGRSIEAGLRWDW